MVSGNDIRQRVIDAWQIADGINADGFLFEFGKKLVRGGFRWEPTSVDPTTPVRYGCVIGSVDHPFSGSPDWLVHVYIGLLSKDFQNGTWDVSPYASIPMIFDAKGKLTSTWQLELWEDSTLKSALDLPPIPAFPFLPPQVNTAIALYSLTILVGNWLLGKFSTDTNASKLSLAPLAGLIMSQTVYGVRAAFKDKRPADLKSQWRRYDQAIQGWDQGKGWKDKSGSAREYSGEGGVSVRMWRPVVFLDEDMWSIHVKFDHLRSVARDDHVIVTASARRSTDRELVTLIAVGDLISKSKTFTFEIDTRKQGDDKDVFDRWGDRLVVEMDQDGTQRDFARTIIAAMDPLMKTIAKAEKG